MTDPTLRQTLDLVALAHNKQSDNLGMRYWKHCVMVFLYFVISHPSAPLDAFHAALLHDILEDTDVQAGDLLDAGYSIKTVSLVIELTKYDDETYSQYIDSIQDPLAIAIKLADLQDNLAPERAAGRTKGMTERYLIAQDTLQRRLRENQQ